MGEIADAMINGELCESCGVYLEPGEDVYLASTGEKVKMPEDDSGFGVPVICYDCRYPK